MEAPFENLAPLYRTGRAFLMSGSGRDKKYAYRHGVATKLGDLEEAQWRQMALSLIESSGEQELYRNLLEWESERNYLHHSKQELELYVLELHMRRIFDDPLWVSYVGFNRRCRPSILERTPLVTIQSDCCGCTGEITEAMLHFAYGRPPTAPCPSCVAFSTFKIL